MKVLDLINWQRQPAVPTVEIAGALRAELKALEPGRVLTIRDTDGRRYVIIDSEDFDHIAAQAGMALAKHPS